MYKTGEKPGKGTYRCTVCGHLLILNKANETLPVCPKCGVISFYKVA